MTMLAKGAIKSAVSAAAGVILAMPAVDPEHFALTTWLGVLHVAGLIAWMTVIAEARYWKDWADELSGSDAKPPVAPIAPAPATASVGSSEKPAEPEAAPKLP